jgi:hypothetical protein
MNISTYVNVSATSFFFTEGVMGDEGVCICPPQQNMNNYHWVRPLEHNHCDQTTAAIPLPLTVSDVDSSMKGYILLSGDSHTRYARNAIDEWCQSKGGCRNFNIDQRDNYYCDTSMVPSKGDVDFPSLLIFNCGHHPASATHYTFSEYHALVIEAAANLTAKGYTPHNLAWMESNVNPFRNDEWVHGYRDWRTPQRIHIFNRLAAEAFHKEHKFPIIPTFAWTLPLADKLCDIGHYTATGALVPLLYEIAALFNVNHRVSSGRRLRRRRRAY